VSGSFGSLACTGTSPLSQKHGFRFVGLTGLCWCLMALVRDGRVGQGVSSRSVWTHTLMEADVGDGWDGCAWLR
jgi:hypothetical protein